MNAIKKIICSVLIYALATPYYVVYAKEAPILLNFQNADLHTIIEVIAKETKKNFLLDPRVRKQKITLIAETPVSREDAYSMFLSILRIYGYGTIESGNVVKILPLNEVRQNEVQFNTGGTKSGNDKKGTSATDSTDKTSTIINSPNDDFIALVVPLYKTKAEQMASIVRSMMPSFGQVIAHGNSNSLILLAPAGVMKKVKDVIKILEDKIEKVLNIVPLKYSTAANVVAIMIKLEAKAIAKTNGLLIIEDKQSNQIVISGGTKEDRVRAIASISQLDVAKKNTGTTQVIYLNYAKSKELAAILKELVTATDKNKKKDQGVSITADENTNSLVIHAPITMMQEIKNAIVQLDIRKAQVLIQAIIVEISDSDVANLGVRWGLNTKHGVGFIDFSGAGSLASIFTLTDNKLRVSDTPAFGGGGNIGVGQINKGNNRGWFAFLNLLKSDSEVNILSTPSVVTLDNEEATLFVGEEVSILTRRGEGTTAGTTFTNFERKKVGLTLKVIPQINQGDAMQLKIEQKVENVQPGESGLQDFTERNIKTSVVIADKEVLVLGGLTRQQIDNTSDKILGLSDIPILGKLFQSRRDSSNKRTLMLFIKTDIIRDFKTSQAISLEKYSNLYKETDDRKSLKLIDKNNTIILPKYHEDPIDILDIDDKNRRKNLNEGQQKNRNDSKLQKGKEAGSTSKATGAQSDIGNKILDFTVVENKKALAATAPQADDNFFDDGSEQFSGVESEPNYFE